MIVIARRRLANRVPLRLAACCLALLVPGAARAAEEPAHSAALDEAIIKAAARHGVPEKLVRRIVMRESRYNPRARNHLYWGLMQISYPTAKSMGFKGTPEQLLNPVVNLTYAVPYLANAFIIAGKQEDAAVRLYASGYYATAKRRGLLGVLRTAESTPLSGQPEEPTAVATAPPPPSYSIFGALFSPAQQAEQPPRMTQAAYAPPSDGGEQPAQAAPSGTAPPQGKASDDDVTLTADKQGVLQPPKKWLHDGGVTVIARGEQSVEAAVANEKAVGSESEKARQPTHLHKTTTFAALEVPPASAQAYAPPAAGQNPQLSQAASQAAITQATSGQPAPTQPMAAQADRDDPGARQQAEARAADARATEPSASDAPATPPARRHHAKHAHARKPTEAAVAQRTEGGQPPQAPVQTPQ